MQGRVDPKVAGKQNYRLMLESLPQIVWTLDADGRCDYLSPQWKEYTGLDASEAGKGWVEHVHPDERAEIRERLRISLRTGQSFDAECRLKGADGQYRRFRSKAVPVRGSEDALQNPEWIGTITRIHEQNVTEAALRSAEANFRQLVDAMPQMVWFAAADGASYYYNPRCSDYLGLTPGQITDSGWRTNLHPDDKRACLDHRALCLRTGRPYAVEYRFLRASDQTWRWHLERGAPTFDADRRIAGWIGTCTDIEDYKQATVPLKSLNDGLDQRGARLQGILDAATQVSIIATDTEGIIQIFNSGAERMLQYQAAEMEGVHTLEIIHDGAECAERSQLLSSQFGQPVEGFNAVFEYACRGKAEEREWTYVRKDGTRLDVNLAVTAVCNPEGAFQGLLCIATDITARKSLEREFRRSNEKLLSQTKSAEEANLAKSDFLAAMSHEIRTPMNAVLGMADLLWESKLDAEQIQYVDVIRHAGANLLLLINDILDLSKIEAGRLELERIEFQLEKVVDETVEVVSLRARAKGLSLKRHSSPDVPTVLVGDPNRLRQILINILGNAIKFTDSGAIELGVRNHESGRPGEIEFLISDTGIGIPADKLETIFDDFTQADTSTTRRYGGSGLGLGISRRLVETMNGRLTVTSSVGKGSTFRFNAQFQMAPVGGREAPPELLKPPPSVSDGEQAGRLGKPLRILLVDDAADNRLLVRAYLKGSGHRLDIAEDGKAAVDRFRVGDFDLILMDMQMPVMDGLTATRAIRSIERQWGTAAVPIIAITANARAQDIEKSHQAGCNVHLSKPISKLKLFHVIEDYRIRGWRETIGIEMQPGLEEITPGYLAARREEVPVLMALLAASDFKRIAHLAHRIKGTGTSYGFGELSRISAALEAAAERRDSSATGAQLGQLTNYLEHVQLIAQEVRPPAEAPDTILRDQ